MTFEEMKSAIVRLMEMGWTQAEAMYHLGAVLVGSESFARGEPSVSLEELRATIAAHNLEAAALGLPLGMAHNHPDLYVQGWLAGYHAAATLEEEK
mgnify:CR=1 FL=1